MAKKSSVALALVLLACGIAARGASPEPDLELRFAGGTFRPLSPPARGPSWFEGTPLAAGAAGDLYLVAIARAPLGPAERTKIEDTGARILDYVAMHGYRLRVPPAAQGSIRALPFVEWLGPLPAHLKIGPELASDADAGTEREVSVRILLEAGEPASRVLDATSGLQVQSAPSGRDGAWRIVAAVPGARLGRLLSRIASLPEVEAIEPVRRMIPLNQDAVWVHQSFVGPSPQQTPVFDRGIYGCGQIVAVADTGQDYGACFFRDAVNGPPPISSCSAAPCPAASPEPGRRKDILYYNWSTTPTGDDDTCPSTITGSSGHGTHTSGSVAGDNTPYADCSGFTTPGRSGGDGQAPGAKLVIQELGDGLEFLNNLGGSLWNLADVAYQNGARIHSNSWGGACYDVLGNCLPGCTMPYDSYARDADAAMWSHPDLLLVFSAGNAGEFCAPPLAVGTPAIAKSALAVGSVGHGVGADTPSTFTSPGPVFDGRLKPTLAAQGEGVFSAASDASPATSNCTTCSLDGSSMSAPTAAGHAALVREYYAAGFYAAGTRNPAAGFVPSGALLKATLIDGAEPLNGSPSPDFVSGYGRILLGSTLAFTGSPFKLRVDDQRDGITTGSIVTHAYDVSAGTPFRATLVWTDFPAALNAASARVNELKLEVVDPAGNVWFQTLDPGTGAPVQTSSPSAPHDAINVEERLAFPTPAAGRWIVRVLGVDVPWGPQPFALVVRGALTDCAAPAAPGPLTLSTPADRQVRVSWGAVPGAVRYNVHRSFGACPAGPWVPVATAVTDTSFLDTGVSGSVRYAYRVSAASDPAAACLSPPSPCADVVPTGDCTLPPDFRGVSGAQSAGSQQCAVNLSWEAATARCPGEIRYNVYRSTSPGFTPGPGNRIARCVIGSGYADATGLSSGTRYSYAVRAEDATTGHAGPCHGGNEDANQVQISTAPDGAPVVGTWSDDAGDTGEAKLSGSQGWTAAATGGNLAPRVYTVTSAAGLCADLTTPPLTLADPGQGPQLFFATRHDLEFDPAGIFDAAEGSIGQVEIASGPAFGNWTRLPLTPDYPTFVDFTVINCTSTLDGMTYFTGPAPSYATYSASLANWGAGDVRIRFHLSGDYFYSTGNWWVDDVRVTHSLVPDSCTTLAAGPPPIPDGGAVPGIPLRASRSGSNVLIAWDASRCPATSVNVYRGAIGNFTAFTAGSCGLPASGSATLALPNNVWFLVAASDGASTDGSWGRTLTGAERSYSGASLACPAITRHVTNNGCP